MKIFAQLISWVFIPLLMPIYGLLVAMYVPSVEQNFFQENTLFWMQPGHKIAVLLMFLIFSFLAPAISLVMLQRSNTISTIELDKRKERTIPIFLTAIYALILSVFLLVKAPDDLLPKIIYFLPWGGFVSIVVSGIITQFDKISIHGLGCGMLYAFFIYYYNTQVEYYFEIIIITTIIVGLVMSSRLYLQKHTLKQVLNGFMVGFLCMFLTITFLSSIIK
jgi:membrane-associated phospholipid phosphatase